LGDHPKKKYWVIYQQIQANQTLTKGQTFTDLKSFQNILKQYSNETKQIFTTAKSSKIKDENTTKIIIANLMIILILI